MGPLAGKCDPRMYLLASASCRRSERNAAYCGPAPQRAGEHEDAPARAAPNSAASAFTINRVGIAATNGEKPSFAFETRTKQALREKPLDFLGDAPCDVDTAPRAMRKREIAGHSPVN